MALSALTVWEGRTTGSEANAGGFVSGGLGTDYSQQDAAQVVFDAVTKTLSSAAASATLNVAGATPDATWVNNLVNITGGTNFIAGTYWIQSTNTGTITLDRAATSAAGSLGTGNLGGAKVSLGGIFAVAVAGNKVWQKSGLYLITSTANNVAGGCFTFPANSGTNLVVLSGYDLVRGDMTGNQPINRADNVITAFTMATGGTATFVFNVEFDGNLRTTSKGYAAGAGGSHLFGCVIRNFTNSGWTASNNSSRFLFGRLTGCTTATPFVGGLPYYSVFDSCTITPVFASAGIVAGCTFVNNTGASTDGILCNSNILVDCTAAFNGRHNFNGSNVNQQLMFNCLSWAPGSGDGYTSSLNNVTPTLFNCYSGGATSGANFNANYAAGAKINCGIINANPFVDSTVGNFLVNTIANAGLPLRGVGLGAVGPGTAISRVDIGAFQHLDASMPDIANVLAGIAYSDGALTGTLTLPLASHLLAGDVIGVGGTSVTGTLTLPLASQVVSGVTCGIGGNSINGTVTLPNTSLVLDGVNYGAGGNQFTGNVVLPDVTNVKNGVFFGANSALVGLASVAAAPPISDSAKYNKLALVAERLINKNGRLVALHKNATALLDPAKPWRGTNPAALTGGLKTVSCNAVILREDDEEGTSDNIRRGKEYALVAARSANDGTDITDLRDYSTLVVVATGETWDITGVKPLAPGDITIYYRLELSR